MFSGVGLWLGFPSPHRRIMFFFCHQTITVTFFQFISLVLFEILSVCHGSMAVSARVAVASGSVLIDIQYWSLLNFLFGALSVQHHNCANLLILFLFPHLSVLI